MKLQKFFEFWTLKESYIKAIGIGLGMELKRIQFKTQKETQTEGNIDTYCKLFKDNILQVSNKKNRINKIN